MLHQERSRGRALLLVQSQGRELLLVLNQVQALSLLLRLKELSQAQAGHQGLTLDQAWCLLLLLL